MIRKIYFALPLLALFACGEKGAEQEEVVKLDTFKDRISYALGAEQAKMVTESGVPNLDKLDINQILEGFNEGISSKGLVDQACQETLKSLYGPYGQDFDTTYLKAGSTCIGKTVGSVFSEGLKKKGALKSIDMSLAKIGFKHAMEKRDTLIDLQVRSKMVNDFMVDLNRKSGAAMLEMAKKLPNVEILQSGIVIQTIEAGKGGSPLSSDDVMADYVLTGSAGDTIESSFKYRMQTGQPSPAFNLSGVIRGWTEGFPHLKKGGKYKLFVPAELAYGAQNGFESLCFYIEFHDFGKAGSLAKPQPEQPQQQH